MPEQNSFSYTLTPDQGKKLESVLKEQAFEFSDLDYGFFKAKKGKCNVSYYKSGKVLINGKDSKQFVEFYFEPEVTGVATVGYHKELNPEMYEPHFGIDESGKGDFFGPLVIAGAYVNDQLAEVLMELGVKDSKRITSDKKAMDLGEEISKLLKNQSVVVVIGPRRYNELYKQFGNLNDLLAWGHSKAIQLLHEAIPDCPRALSDKFAHASLIERQLKAKKINIKLDQRTKAESDVAVAAASILARAAFLRSMKSLGEQVMGQALPKGASDTVIEAGKLIVEKYGQDRLDDFAKTHFSTYKKVVDSL